MNGSNDGPSIFDSIFGKGKPIKWYHYLIHLGYYIPYWIKFFFSEPFKEKKKDLNILDTVKSLLESETTDGNIKKSKELIHLHRIVENTKARRRLEKWSLRVIALYLFIVLCIVLASYVSIPAIKSSTGMLSSLLLQLDITPISNKDISNTFSIISIFY